MISGQRPTSKMQSLAALSASLIKRHLPFCLVDRTVALFSILPKNDLHILQNVPNQLKGAVLALLHAVVSSDGRITCSTDTAVQPLHWHRRTEVDADATAWSKETLRWEVSASVVLHRGWWPRPVLCWKDAYVAYVSSCFTFIYFLYVPFQVREKPGDAWSKHNVE